jgi:photosystem II stability/assembly factor-like uncharacterized protein
LRRLASAAVTLALIAPASVAPAQVGAPRSPTLACASFSFTQRTQRSFAVDPTDDRTMYIGVAQEGFFKSMDGGATWVRASTGLKAWGRDDDPARPCYEEFYETVINPRNPRQLCVARAGSPGLLSSQTSAALSGIYCSDDAAATWSQRHGPAMNTAAVTIAVHPTDFNVMYVGVNGGPCSNPPPVCAPGTYFNSVGAIYKTADGGVTWVELNAHYVRDQRAVALRIDERNPDVLVAATFGKLPTGGPGNFADAPQVEALRSTDGGRTWTASLAGMSAAPSEQALLELGLAPRNASRAFATAASNRSYWSADGGATWQPAMRVDAFAFDPHDAAGLHLVGANDRSIVESRDGGRTWSNKAGLPSAFTRERGLPTQVVWSRTEPNRLWLNGPRATVLESRDGGATWRQILSADALPR